MIDNVYLKENEDWQNKIKYGYVNGNSENLVQRLADSREEHSERSEFINIYTFKKTDSYMLSNTIIQIDKIISNYCSDIGKLEIIEDIYNIKLPLMCELNKYLVKSKTKQTNEFVYKDGIPLLIRVLKEEFPKLGLELVKEYSSEEIQKINNDTVVREREQFEEEYNKQLMELKALPRRPNCDDGVRLKEETKWFEREYQRTIIKYGLETLSKLHKFYLELATGGGKSYIIYKILSQIKPNTIVIFSPRKNINKQNCSDKYLCLLNDEYLVYNCSESIHFDNFKTECCKQNKKMMIVACPQKSHEKVYDIIQEYNLNDIFIWFDEAHNTIEKWVNKIEDRYVNFFLCDNERINNRIFTSASPDKKHIETHTEIFGEHYLPVKVKQLIHLKWLCDINCKVLEYDILNLNLLNWILNGFIQNNKSFGFSFHSRDNNAFNLFHKHYELYKKSNTEIKPYLLINDKGLNESNRVKLNLVDLEYDFRNDKHFENDIKIPYVKPKNMAYVVKQYDMGYDFKELDYIVITDTKSSYKDIIQCIGRGTRSDKKGENGKNCDKNLLVMLPTYVKEEDNNEYKNIIEVLRYLILDLDIDIMKELIYSDCSSDSKDTIGVEYKGKGENTSKLLDLLYANNILKQLNTKTLVKCCVQHNIKTEQDYYKFKRENPSLHIKSNLYEYPGFYWKNVVDPNNEIYYTSKLECIKSKEKIIKHSEALEDDEYEEFMNDIDDNGWIELNKHDPKIPPYRDLDKYYP